MPSKLAGKTITKKPHLDDAVEEEQLPNQRRRPEAGPFRLQVDSQTKASFATYKEAASAGLVIKKGHPVVQVTVYDAVKGETKTIELANTDS